MDRVTRRQIRFVTRLLLGWNGIDDLDWKRVLREQLPTIHFLCVSGIHHRGINQHGAMRSGQREKGVWLVLDVGRDEF